MRARPARLWWSARPNTAPCRPRRRTGTPSAPSELAARLVAERHVPIEGGPTFDRLTRQNRTLSQVELELLADAIDREGDVVIGYRDRTGNRTVRRIRPEQLLAGWLDSWCYLREDERNFAVANIETVEAAR